MRKLVIVLSFGLCCSALWAVRAQRQQLRVLQAERQQQASMAAADSAEVPQGSTGQTAEPDTPPEAVSIELLRLRGEVTRITDWRGHLERHRREIVVGAAVVGFALGARMLRRRRRGSG